MQPCRSRDPPAHVIHEDQLLHIPTLGPWDLPAKLPAESLQEQAQSIPYVCPSATLPRQRWVDDAAGGRGGGADGEETSPARPWAKGSAQEVQGAPSQHPGEVVVRTNRLELGQPVSASGVASWKRGKLYRSKGWPEGAGDGRWQWF